MLNLVHRCYCLEIHSSIRLDQLRNNFDLLSSCSIIQSRSRHVKSHYNADGTHRQLWKPFTGWDWTKILWRDGMKNFGMERDGVKNFGTWRKNLGRVRCLAAFTNSSMRSGLLRAFPPFLLFKAVTCKQAFVQFFHGTGRNEKFLEGAERDE